MAHLAWFISLKGHVEEDPASFVDAYWDIASLTVWSPAEAEEAVASSQKIDDHAYAEDPVEPHPAAH